MSESRSAEQLAVRVTELEVRVAQLPNELEDMMSLITQASGSAGTAPSPLYDTLDDWVRECFAPTFGRPIGGEIRWCAHWRETRRSHRPTGGALAIVGGAAPRSRHGHGHMADPAS